MAERRALITGITGQDGSYLAEFLLGQGYQVFGLARRRSTDSFDNIAHILDQIELITGDLADSSSLFRAMERAQPHEIYNLAAQSFVKSSWELPEMTGDVTGIGVTRLLESMRVVCPSARFYQASSSEMFGLSEECPQNEKTPFHPRSPYAVAKVYGHWSTVNYRESYGLFACCGILFNHESPRRGLEFVTRKVAHAVARIKLGLSDRLPLGNLDARRDWGFAGEYVVAMWRMLQQDEPEDFVIGTGEDYSVRDLVEAAFSYVDLDWQDYVTQDERFMRPAEVPRLLADCTRSQKRLEWNPQVRFQDLVEMMVQAELERLNNSKKPEDATI